MAVAVCLCLARLIVSDKVANNLNKQNLLKNKEKQCNHTFQFASSWNSMILMKPPIIIPRKQRKERKRYNNCKNNNKKKKMTVLRSKVKEG